MPEYLPRLQLAIQKTKAIGLSIDEFTIVERGPSKLAAAFQEEIADAIYAEFGKPVELRTFAAQCCEVSLRLKPHVDRIMGTSSLVTIGGVDVDGVAVVPAREPSLLSMAITGDYHVWLTLPWLEVLDFTLLASLSRDGAIRATSVTPLVGRPELFSSVRWRPWFVGGSAARRLLKPFE